MHLVRYRHRATGQTGLAARHNQRGHPQPLATPTAGFAELLRLPRTEVEARVAAETTNPGSADDVDILSPCDGRMEIWAAGVTYLRSRNARVEESTERSVYDRIYDAARPELFFKAVPWRVVTDGGFIAVRSDSPLNVPEPELAVLINAHREPIGYTICNDISSRSIEGENPLYLPQAKMYEASCALAAAVRPAWEVANPYTLGVRAQITRGPDTVWEDQTSTASLRRNIDDLIDWLFAQQAFPDGVVLSTGTGLVPPMDVTLLPGDQVYIAIDEVGELTNLVVAANTRSRHHETGSRPV